MLPEIRPSSDPNGYGTTRAAGALGGEITLTGDLGDQQAATVGQVCFAPGEAKNTYGTGNFMLLNTGTELVRSNSGLLTTVCYKFGDEPAVYALEGSIAVTGSAVQWLRDQLGIIGGAAESETLAAQVEDNGGVYFVPAFSGLFAPYWRSDARGAIVGPVPVQHQRPPGPGHPGGDLLPEPGRRRGDGEGLRCRPRRAQGRRRHHRQRPVHADPGRRARRPGEQAGGGRDDRARRGVRGRAGGRLLEQHRRAAGELERGQALAAGVEPRSSATPATPAGRRRSSAHWTGWTSTSRPSSSRPRPKETRGPHGSRRTLARRTLRSTGRDGRGGARRARRRGGVVGSGAALDAATRGLRVGLVEARDMRQRHVEPVQQAAARRPALPGDARLRAGARGAAGARSASSADLAPHLARPLPFLYPLQHRFWERPYVGPAILLYDAMAAASPAGPRAGCRGTGT